MLPAERVCLQNKKLWRDFDEIFRKCQNGTRNRSFKFGGDPDHQLDNKILIALVSNGGGVRPWQRYALSE